MMCSFIWFEEFPWCCPFASGTLPDSYTSRLDTHDSHLVKFWLLSSLHYLYISNHISCSLGQILCSDRRCNLHVNSGYVAGDQGHHHQLFIWTICTFLHISLQRHTVPPLKPLGPCTRSLFFWTYTRDFFVCFGYRRFADTHQAGEENKCRQNDRRERVNHELISKEAFSKQQVVQVEYEGEGMGSCLQCTWRASNLSWRAMSRVWYWICFYWPLRVLNV